jgi:hypothetical protein
MYVCIVRHKGQADGDGDGDEMQKADQPQNHYKNSQRHIDQAGARGKQAE